MTFLPRSTLIPLALLFVFGYVVFEALGKPMQAKLFPMTVGILGVALITVVLVKEFWVAWRAHHSGSDHSGDDQGGAADFAITEAEKTRAGRLRAAEQFAWLAGLLAGLFLLGFYISVPLMVGLYLWRHQERPVFVMCMVAGVAVVVWGVFNKLLYLPFPKGLIFEWLM